MRHLMFVIACLAAAACEAPDQSASELHAFDVEEQAPDTDAVSAQPAPQIAYSYSYSYRLPGDRIDEAQRAHLALCDRLGQARCRIVTMQQSSDEGDYSSASLELIVEAAIARPFGARLDATVGEADGTSTARAIEAEDLSKAIVDTEARIRAKQALADRLLALIANRAGSIGELVEAERAFAQAQEELDAARTWLREMRGRVAMSTIAIDYQSATAAGGLWTPVRDAFASAGRIFGWSLAALISIAVVVLPWIAVIGLIAWLLRRSGGARFNPRRLFGRKPGMETEEPDQTSHRSP